MLQLQVLEPSDIEIADERRFDNLLNAAILNYVPLCILALIPNTLCADADISLTVSYYDPLDEWQQSGRMIIQRDCCESSLKDHH